MRPGFIKTGVDPGPLSPIDRKLIEAAVICHGQTGLRIHCHTGDGRAAMDILAPGCRLVRGDRAEEGQPVP